MFFFGNFSEEGVEKKKKKKTTHFFTMSSLVSFVLTTVTDSVTRIRRTLWRNRRRVAVLAVLSGVAVLGWRALWRRLDAMHRDQVRRLESRSVQNARRRAYFNDAQATADAYARAALKLLHARLDALIALPSPLELRGAGGSKERKLELWTAFKVGSFARLLAAVYALCMSLLLVRIQLNLVSRYVHLRSLQRAAATPNDDPNSPAASAAAAVVDEESIGPDRRVLARGGHAARRRDTDRVFHSRQISRADWHRRHCRGASARRRRRRRGACARRADRCRRPACALSTTCAPHSGPRGEQRLLLRAVLSPDSETTVSASGELDVIGLLVNETISVLESDACRIVLDKCVSDAVMLALAGIAGDAGTPLVRLVVHIGRAADKLLLDDAGAAHAGRERRAACIVVCNIHGRSRQQRRLAWRLYFLQL
jgi:hypothetical protein